ncbi:glycogen synthesis protein GlgS [Yersinia intermedia]|nr:glycogen synthesis protein GlgS [Yersinia intermedia]CNH32599.1 glycogen synthesis protein GlgS [Yersinia intermedia]
MNSINIGRSENLDFIAYSFALIVFQGGNVSLECINQFLSYDDKKWLDARYHHHMHMLKSSKNGEYRFTANCLYSST